MSLNEIDPKISKLVKTINSYPGLVTVMSCGGHRKPLVGNSQVPENEFYIEFKFTMEPPTQEAWASFQSIIRLIDEGAIYYWALKPDSWVKIEICGLNKCSEVEFRLHGLNVDPNKLSRMANREISW